MKCYKWYHPLISGWNSKSLWKGFLRGAGIYYLSGLPLSMWDPKAVSLVPVKKECETQRLTPWPQKKGVFVAILLCGFLKLRSTFASLGTRALEKGLIELHKAQESPGKKGPESETFNSFSMKFKIGNLPGMALMKEYWKGKVIKNLQSLRISQESDHFSPPPRPPWSDTSLSLLDYCSCLLIVLPTQLPDTNTLKFKTAAEWCFYSLKT